MTPTTFTIESVHGLKQTVVLVPEPAKTETVSSGTTAETDRSSQQDRPRSSK